MKSHDVLIWHFVGWVAFFNPTDPNSNLHYNVFAFGFVGLKNATQPTGARQSLQLQSTTTNESDLKAAIYGQHSRILNRLYASLIITT
jgi:hypothetical protein